MENNLFDHYAVTGISVSSTNAVVSLYHTVNYYLRINSHTGTTGSSILPFFLLVLSCGKLLLGKCPNLYFYLKCVRVPTS